MGHMPGDDQDRGEGLEGVAPADPVERLLTKFRIRIDRDLTELTIRHERSQAIARYWRRAFWFTLAVALMLGGWVLMLLTCHYLGLAACAAALIVFNLYV